MKYQFGLSILVLALTATFSVGCMKVKKKDEVVQQTATEVQQAIDENPEQFALSPSSLKIKYHGQPIPNQYTAELLWPNSTTKSIYRIIGDKNVSTETTENSLTLNQLKGGIEIKIIFEQYEIATQKRLASFDVIISPPEDYVFDGVISLVENLDKNVERLFFTANAKVYTNQFNLKITAKNIYSEFGATLSNFPEGSVAEMEVVGLSGGKTEIITEHSEGNLQVIMNAQKGGEGRWGWKEVVGDPSASLVPKISFGPYPGCNPNSGAGGGNSGSIFIKINDSESTNFSVATSMMTATGGQAGQLYESLMYAMPGSRISNVKNFRDTSPQVCKNEFTNGQPGHPGQICTKMSATENFKCEKF